MGAPAFLAELARPDRREVLAGGVRSGYLVVAIFGVLLVLGDAVGALAQPGPLYALVGLKLLTNTAAWWALRTERAVMFFSALNVAMDVVAMTGAVHWTGGAASPLFSIYVVEAAVLAMLTNARVTLLVVAGALVLYAVSVAGTALGWWPGFPPPGVQVPAENRPLYLVVKLAFDAVVLGSVTLFLLQNLRRLARQSEKLQAQTESLVEAARERSEFMANVTHELRTPIFGISGLCDLLEAKIGGPLSDRQRHFVAQIRASAQNLLHLVDSLLQLAKAEARATPLRTEPIELREWIPNVVAGARWMVGTRPLRLDVVLPEGPLPVLRSDRAKLNHVLLNLLSNAIKVSPEGGVITLAVEIAAEGVLFSVRDEGPGIVPEDRRRIFESFEQGDGSDARPFGGLGIGLGLVRRLVAVLGGKVSVASEVGAGSTFFVFVPFEPRGDRGGPEVESWDAVVPPDQLRALREEARRRMASEGGGGGEPGA